MINDFSGDSSASSDAPPPPIPHSYWVEPGRLLAGEYPGPSAPGEAATRLEKLLEAGITCFIDLTERGELPSYDTLLASVAGVEHRRFPIRDHGVPASPSLVVEALDAIDAALAAGHTVYVHCRAGIGRTGTLVGCYLARRRRCRGSEALALLQHLWRQCLRSRSWPEVPETAEQIEFVRAWREPALARSAGLTERAQGALIGLAIGEALGWLASEIGPDAQAVRREASTPGADLRTGIATATTVCLAESLLACAGHEPQDQMQRYAAWLRSVARDEPLSGELRRALAAWQWSRKPLAGTHDPNNRDPHSLARTVAVALYWCFDPPRAVELAAEASRTTHQSPVVLEACRVWAALLIDALSGMNASALLTMQSSAAIASVRQRGLRKDVLTLVDGRWRTASSHGGGVLSVIGTALWAFERATTFDDGLFAAITVSRAPQTVGALYGTLAGASGGVPAIAPEWRAALAQEAQLRALAERLLDGGAL